MGVIPEFAYIACIFSLVQYQCRVHIPSAPVVEKVCEYMSFKAHYEGPGSKEDIPMNEITERIPPEIALELYVL